MMCSNRQSSQLSRFCLSNVVGVMMLLSSAAYAGSTIYVDDDAPLGGDGLTWDTAYRFMQDALTNASGGGISEIHVAQGTYKPDRDDANPEGTGDRTATFQLLNNISLMGGYAGIFAKNPDARDIDIYETILTGDLLGDDGSNYQNNNENSIHVVDGSLTYPSAVIDGFTITAGNADNGFVENDHYGGGIFVYAGWPRILNCTLIKSVSDWGGGGICSLEGNATLEDCKIISCSAYGLLTSGQGGYTRCTFTGPETWLKCTYSNPLIEDCVFQDIANTTRSPIYIIWSNPKIINCVFADNTKQGDGGAIDLLITANAQITNCLFVNNYAAGNGGAIKVTSGYGLPSITNSTFFYNLAQGQGNVIYNEYGSPIINNCELSFNVFENFLPAIVDNGPEASTTVNYSNIDFLGWGGDGTNNINVNPLFVDVSNGDFRLKPGSLCIDAGDNGAVPAGIVSDMGGEPRFVDDPDTKDTGNGVAPIVDIGAYEFQVELLCPWDLDGNGSVSTGDLLELFTQWGTNGTADFDGSGAVGTGDLLILFANWGPCI